MSHETIYQALYVQTRGRLRADLHRQLSLKRRIASPAAAATDVQGPYTEAFTISQRPPRSPTGPCPGTGKAT